MCGRRGEFDNGLEFGIGARYVASQFIAEDNQFQIRDVLTLDASVSYAYRLLKIPHQCQKFDQSGIRDARLWLRFNYSGQSIWPVLRF